MQIILNNVKPTKPLNKEEHIYEIKNLLKPNDLTTVIGTKHEVESYIDHLMVVNENGVYQYDEV